jgi:hypothetical protein
MYIVTSYDGECTYTMLPEGGEGVDFFSGRFSPNHNLPFKKFAIGPCSRNRLRQHKLRLDRLVIP